MAKTGVIKKRILILIFAACAAGALLFVAWHLQSRTVAVDADQTDSWGNDEITASDGTKYVRRDDTESLLLIGIDNDGEMKAEDSYLNDNLADVLMLTVVDDAKKEYTTLQIDRDTITDIPVLGIGGGEAGKTRTQIARAYTYGTGMTDSSVNTVEAVANLLGGAGIDHYATLSLKAIGILNGDVDGVEVTIVDDFSKIDDTMTGTLTLSDEQAQNYVRARQEMDDDTNIARMVRQRDYFTKWIDRFSEKAADDDTFATHTVLDISDYYVSDLPPDILANFAVAMTEYKDNGIISIKGTSKTVDGYAAFYADRKALEKQVIKLLYEKK